MSVRVQKCLRRLLLLSAILPLCACAAKRMRSDFTGFESAYAETSNREVLLNLARLENRDPTYFFKLGQITSAYRMQAALPGAANYTPQGTTPGGAIVSGGITPSVLYENDPVFQFIPVNDDTNAQLLLKPIPPETFYILYQQGWRVDQLFRLLVDRIELTRLTGTRCDVEVIRNLAPPIYTDATGKAYTPDPDTLRAYVTFLRVSAVVYALQKHGLLLLRGAERFVPFDNNSGIAANEDKSLPIAKDQNDAVGKNTVWEKDAKGNWILGRKVFTPIFYLNPLAENDKKELVPDTAAIEEHISPDLPELREGGEAMHQALQILANGFSIHGTATPQQLEEGACPTKGISSHLVMRSLIGLMSAAAQEEIPFDALLNSDPEIPFKRTVSAQEQESVRRFKDAVPRIEQEPLLRITWKPDDTTTAPLTRVLYRGVNYSVADLSSPVNPENQYWNRDMFRLISNLTSQVTVDISKFPLPEILQLHTQ